MRLSFVLIVAALGGLGECVFLSAVDVVKLSHLVVDDLFDLWPSIRRFAFKTKDEGLPTYSQHRRVLSKMDEILRKVKEFESQTKEYDRETQRSILDLPRKLMYEAYKDKIISHIDRTDRKFKEYQLLISTEGNRTFEPHTITSFANYIVDFGEGSMRSTMNELHEMVMGMSGGHQLFGRRAMFDTILENSGSSENLCEIDQSPQQLIYNTYNLIQLTLMKCHSMIQFSWMILKSQGKGNFTWESTEMKTKYLKMLSEEAKAVYSTLQKAERSIWKCDPKKFIKGETYTEVTKLLQGFIINEIDINDEASCSESCPYYEFTQQKNCYENNVGCTKQSTCAGDVVNCKYIDSDMEVCLSPMASSRRYDWISYENGRTLGERKSCKRPILQVDSWWRYLVWHCSFCFCYCDSHNSFDTDRYFYMGSVTTNTSEDKVVTGMRFIKVNRVIYLQLQEGKLLPKSAVDPTTLSWIPVKEIKVRDKKYQHGVDYFKLTYRERAIDLDELMLPENAALTGVRFRKIGSHMNFEIQGTEYDFETGKLNGKVYWISNDNTELGQGKNKRMKLELQRTNVPTKTVNPSMPDSTTNQYIQFQASDMDDDAAQSTVPYIDTQPVSSHPPMVLTGAGIYHKMTLPYAGFIGPKIYTSDLKRNMVSDFPELQEESKKETE